MKKNLLALLLFASVPAFSQCPFDPTVEPDNLILCPFESDTIFTQQYDSYQWFQNNNLIPGATNQFHIVNSSDAGSTFRVSATLDSCTEPSPEVLVDGYIFLLPFVIHSGDLGTFDPNIGATVLCEGDTLILTLGLPYNTNVQWFNNGDSIQGATASSLFVSESGVYTVCGAPEVCPNFISCLGLDIAVLVMNPQPVITQSNDTLLSNIIADDYQWLLNGNAITGATNDFYIPQFSGEYTVDVSDSYGCIGSSESFFFTATYVREVSGLFHLTPSVTSDLIFITSTENISSVMIYDQLGNVRLEPVTDNSLELDVSELPAGTYYVYATFQGKTAMKKFVKY